MSETIKKSLGEGHGKGELYAALAHDTSDKFGGMEIKSICMNWSTYDEETGDGRICFFDRDMYIAPYEEDSLDIVAGADLWLFATDIFLVGTVHYYGEVHEVSTAEFDVLITDPTEGVNAVHGLIDAGVAWTSGNLVALRGMVSVSGAGNAVVSATGVWAGLDFADAIGAKTGLICALNAEVSADNASKPNAIVYIQSLPGSGANFSTVPYLVFSETRTGTGSYILFEVGHSEAATTPEIGNDKLFYHDTLQIAVNEASGVRTPFFIPLSTDSGTFTTEYPIITTYNGDPAIDIGTCTTGIDITSPTTGININGTVTTGITIGTGCATGISMTNMSTYAIQIVTNGRFIMGTMDIGIPVATAKLNAMEVHTEPAADLTPDETGISCGIRSRYHISNAQSTTISIIALEGRLRVKAALADGCHAGVCGTIEAGKNTDAIAFTGSSTTQRSAGNFCVELSAQSTLANNGWLCGVTIDSSVHGDVDVSSACTFAGLRIKTSSAKEPWTYGIYMGDDDAVTGIQIGNCTTGIQLDGVFTSGIRVANTCASVSMLGIRVDNIVTCTSGWNYGVRSNCTFSAEGNVAAVAVLGELKMAAKLSGTACQSGVRGLLHFYTGTDIENASCVLSAVNAVMIDSGSAGAYTTVNHICGLYVDNQVTADLSAVTGSVSLIFMANNSLTCTIDNAIFIYGPNVTNFVNFSGCTYSTDMIEAQSESTDHFAGTIKSIKIVIDTVDYYLLASTSLGGS